MAKEEALVLSDENENLFVLPVEYVATSRVDAKSKDIVLRSLSKPEKDVKLGSSYTFRGVIFRTDAGEWPRDATDSAWPHYVTTDE